MGLGQNPITSRKKELTENEEKKDEIAEEYDLFTGDESIARRPTRKQGRRVSGVYRELIALAKVGNNAKALECVFQRFPNEMLQKIACISTIWCTVAYRIHRKRCGGKNPFLRVWMAKPHELIFMNFNGELHYHSELLTYGDSQELVPAVDTVLSFGTKIMEEIFHEEDMKFPLQETVMYGLTDKVFMNTDVHWDPFNSLENGWGLPENRSMVGSLFIPKSSYMEIVPFSLPLVRENETDCMDSKMFNDLMLKNYQMEAEDELPTARSIKAILMFQFLSEEFVHSFVNVADNQDIKTMSGIFNTIGFNTNDEHTNLAVGLSFWSKTEDSSCLNISSYAVCMSDANPEKNFIKMKEQCEMYKTSFVVAYSCCNYESPDSKQEAVDKYLSVEEYLDDDQYWYPQKGNGYGTRNEFIKSGIKMFRFHLPNTPMIGAVLNDPLILGKRFLEDNSPEGPIDLGFLVVSYN